jgi:hypothetical protein
MIPTYPTPPTSTLEHLTRIRTVLSNPSHWTRHCLAQHPSGNAVRFDDIADPSTPVSCCCLVGAAIRTSGVLHTIARERVCDPTYDVLHRATSTNFLAAFNDNPKTTHADILAALDLAIEQETSAHAR